MKYDSWEFRICLSFGKILKTNKNKQTETHIFFCVKIILCMLLSCHVYDNEALYTFLGWKPQTLSKSSFRSLQTTSKLILILILYILQSLYISVRTHGHLKIFSMSAELYLQNENV